MTPAPTTASSAPEAKTKLGQFYRAHRPEVLAGIGVVVAGGAYWRSKHPSAAAASTAAATSIDPSTGQVTGSAADIAALQAQASAGSILPSSYDGSTGTSSDGSTGYSGSGYGGSSGGAGETYDPQILTALQGLQTSLTGETAILGGLAPVVNPSTTAPGPSPNSPQAVSVGRTLTPATISATQANLAADKKAAAADPSAKNKAAVKALTSRLSSQAA